MGLTKWGIIARTIESTLKILPRTGKQCRERWHNHLDPNITKDSWTETEKKLIVQLHNVYGNHWSKISMHLPGRTDNAVKNFYYSSLRKRIRKISKALKKKNEKKNEKGPSGPDSYFVKIEESKCIPSNGYRKAFRNEDKHENLEEEAPQILYSLSQQNVQSFKDFNTTETVQLCERNNSLSSQSMLNLQNPNLTAIYSSYLNYYIHFNTWMILNKSVQ